MEVIPSKRKLGSNHFNWKGGYVAKDGYRYFYYDGVRYAEHRVVLENKIGRKLLATERCHHIDLNKLNNDPNNLICMSSSEHSSLHDFIKHKLGLFPKQKKPGKYSDCLNCEEKIYMPPSRVGDKKGSGKFCCNRCKNIYNARRRVRNCGRFI